MVTKMRFGKEY